MSKCPPKGPVAIPAGVYPGSGLEWRYRNMIDGAIDVDHPPLACAKTSATIGASNLLDDGVNMLCNFPLGSHGSIRALLQASVDCCR